MYYVCIKWAKHVIAMDPHRIDCCVSVSCGRGNTGTSNCWDEAVDVFRYFEDFSFKCS